MLKIKDNVDLKELEKFGFRKHIDVYRYELEEVDHLVIPMVLYVYDYERELKITATENSNTHKLDIIYDLIQAGLVEKE